jgi:hypothetical protein
VRLGQAPEPAQERDWRDGDAAAGGRVSLRLGGNSGVQQAVIFGGSVEVGDVLLGEDDGELGMHGRTSFRQVVRAL